MRRSIVAIERIFRATPAAGLESPDEMAATKKALATSTDKPSRTFEVTVAPEGENFLVRLPFDARAVFGQARSPVVVTVDGYSFPFTVAVYGGEYFIGIRRSHRQAAGLEPGRRVSITITRDEQPRVIAPPADLARALAKNAIARAAWEALSFSHKREHAQAVLEAKKPETRARRIEKTIEALTGSKKATSKKKAAAERPAKTTSKKTTSPGRPRP